MSAQVTSSNRKTPSALTGSARAAWLKARKRRNWAIFLVLISFIVAEGDDRDLVLSREPLNDSP